MTFTTLQIRPIMLISLACLLISCSSNVKQNDHGQILKPTNYDDCERGFIRPPGEQRCLNIESILNGKIVATAPVGTCPTDWRKTTPKGFCLPKYQVIACGPFTFACHKTLGDTVRISSDSIDCSEGSLVVTASSPLFNNDGYYLGARPRVACGPLIIGKPTVE